MEERARKYTAKENRRRYRLHYKARKCGVEICTAGKTIKVLQNEELNVFAKKLVQEFRYGVQIVITKKIKN